MNYLLVFVLLILINSSISLFIFHNREITVKKPTLPILNGAENKVRRGRVAGGYVSEKGSEFLPFYTLLYVQKGTSSYSMCAGSIISESYVLSAGHCFENAVQVFLLAGFTSSQIESFTFFDQVPASTNVIVHSAFNSTTIANDIALIKLSKNLTFSLVIQKIKLPSLQSTFLNKTGIVSGFGVYNDSNPIVSNVLRYTFVSVVGGQICTASYGSNFFNSNKQICVDTKGGHASCSGDSGGSLGIFENNTLTLSGIVSYGSNLGCELGHPEVYTKVNSYLSWIQNKTSILL